MFSRFSKSDHYAKMVSDEVSSLSMQALSARDMTILRGVGYAYNDLQSVLVDVGEFKFRQELVASLNADRQADLSDLILVITVDSATYRVNLQDELYRRLVRFAITPTTQLIELFIYAPDKLAKALSTGAPPTFRQPIDVDKHELVGACAIPLSHLRDPWPCCTFAFAAQSDRVAAGAKSPLSPQRSSVISQAPANLVAIGDLKLTLRLTDAVEHPMYLDSADTAEKSGFAAKLREKVSKKKFVVAFWVVKFFSVSLCTLAQTTIPARWL